MCGSATLSTWLHLNATTTLKPTPSASARLTPAVNFPKPTLPLSTAMMCWIRKVSQGRRAVRPWIIESTRLLFWRVIPKTSKLEQVIRRFWAALSFRMSPWKTTNLLQLKRIVWKPGFLQIWRQIFGIADGGRKGSAASVTPASRKLYFF